MAFTVYVQLKETSQPLLCEAINTYQKGDFFCIYCVDGWVCKFPMANIWRIKHKYDEDPEPK